MHNDADDAQDHSEVFASFARSRGNAPVLSGRGGPAWSLNDADRCSGDANLLPVLGRPGFFFFCPSSSRLFASQMTEVDAEVVKTLR